MCITLFLIFLIWFNVTALVWMFQNCLLGLFPSRKLCHNAPVDANATSPLQSCPYHCNLSGKEHHSPPNITYPTLSPDTSWRDWLKINIHPTAMQSGMTSLCLLLSCGVSVHIFHSESCTPSFSPSRCSVRLSWANQPQMPPRSRDVPTSFFTYRLI